MAPVIPTVSQLLTDEGLRRYARLVSELNANFTPHAGQIEVGEYLFSKGARRIFLECGRKWGKAIDITQEIPTFSGMKPLAFVSVGDVIFGPDGLPTRVIAESPIHLPDECYEIKFRDGPSIKASADHRWHVLTVGQRHYGKKVGQVMTTREMFSKHKYGKHGRHNLYIPVSHPVQWPMKELPVDPYVLGLWLGDGSKRSAEISVHDADCEETRTRLASKGYETSKLKEPAIGIRRLSKALRAIKVLGNKHIPHEYLTASIEQRLDLLKGLLDSDGCAKEHGKVEFCNTNRRLADGVLFLLRSLGIKATLTEKIPRIGDREYAKAFLVHCSPHIQVFALKRKAARLESYLNNSQRRFRVITSIKRCESIPMKCLMVDNESHLFLATEHFIPTHNTEFCIDLCWRLGNMIKNGQGYYFGALAKSVREFLWAPRRLQLHGPEDYIAEIHKTEMRLTFTSGTFIKLDGADEYRASKGFNPDFCILDEYADYPEEFWQAMSPNFASKDCLVIIISSPPWDLEVEPGKPVQFIRLADLWKSYMDKAHRDGKNSRYIYLNQPSHMNEANLPPGFLAQEEKDLTETGERHVWEREYLARRVRAGGRRLVGTFDRDRHMLPHDELMARIERDKGAMEWLDIVDPSSTAFGALIMAINPYTKEVFFLDEILEHDENETTEHAIWPRLNAKEEELNLYGSKSEKDEFTRVCDEAEQWWIVGCRNDPDIGVYFMPTEKFSHPIEAGLSTLRTIFRLNRGFVSDRCQNFAWQMEHWRRGPRGDIPKTNKDLIDCSRYGLHAADFTLSPEDKPLPRTPHPREIQRENYRALENDLADIANVLFKDAIDLYAMPKEDEWVN